MPTIQRTGVLYTTTYKQRWHQAWTRGADPQKCRLAPPPTVKHIGEELGEFSKFSNFDRYFNQNL